MANRRMFSRTVINTDSFIDLPASARALFFHIGLEADDDGFVTNCKSLVRCFGCSQDDLNILVSKGYLIRFESGTCVMTHWKLQNYIQSDRYAPSKCPEAKLVKAVNGVYEHVSIVDTECVQSVSTMDTQYSIGKDRLGKDRLGKDSIELDKDRVTTHTDIYSLLNINDAWRYDVSARRAVTQKLAEHIGSIKPELKCGALMECVHAAMAENGIDPQEIVEIAKVSDGIIDFSARLLGGTRSA